MLNKKQTQELTRKFYENAASGRNAGFEACLLNTQGDLEFMKELFTVRGFRDLLKAALPENQHEIGALKNIPE